MAEVSITIGGVSLVLEPSSDDQRRALPVLQSMLFHYKLSSMAAKMTLEALMRMVYFESVGNNSDMAGEVHRTVNLVLAASTKYQDLGLYLLACFERNGLRISTARKFAGFVRFLCSKFECLPMSRREEMIFQNGGKTLDEYMAEDSRKHERNRKKIQSMALCIDILSRRLVETFREVHEYSVVIEDQLVDPEPIAGGARVFATFYENHDLLSPLKTADGSEIDFSLWLNMIQHIMLILELKVSMEVYEVVGKCGLDSLPVLHSLAKRRLLDTSVLSAFCRVPEILKSNSEETLAGYLSEWKLWRENSDSATDSFDEFVECGGTCGDYAAAIKIRDAEVMARVNAGHVYAILERASTLPCTAETLTALVREIRLPEEETAERATLPTAKPVVESIRKLVAKANSIADEPSASGSGSDEKQPSETQNTAPDPDGIHHALDLEGLVYPEVSYEGTQIVLVYGFIQTDSLDRTHRIRDLWDRCRPHFERAFLREEDFSEAIDFLLHLQVIIRVRGKGLAFAKNRTLLNTGSLIWDRAVEFYTTP